MLYTVHRHLIQNEANSQCPVDTYFQRVGFDLEFDFLHLLADRAAKRVNIIGKPDRLAFMSGRQLIVRKRDGVDKARDMI